MSAETELHSITVPASAVGVATGLRQIADHLVAEDLCLIGLWSTGFGEEWEAVLQYVVERDAAAAADGSTQPEGTQP